MTNATGVGNEPRHSWREFCLALIVILGVITYVFHPSFNPNLVVFANDGNLGITVAHADRTLDTLFGFWQELNLAGIELPSATPNVDFVLFLLLGPVLFAKFTAALSLVAVGMSCWLFLRVLGFTNGVCIVAGLATSLNSNIFSNTCWGLYIWTFSRSFFFLALTAAYSARRRLFWIKMILAGLAVGMSIMEGYDIGAIFSLYMAAYVFFLSWTEPGKTGERFLRAAGRVTVVAVAAALLAAHGLTTLFSTAVKGIAGIDTKQQSIEERFNWSTQWSLPKIEILRVLIPGLMGYRMDTLDGGNYWGTVGQTPGWPEHGQGYSRHSGSGEYAGIVIVLIAGFAAAHLWRKKGNPYSEAERKAIAFWIGVALVSLVLAFGRHAPLYRIIFPLPFFSTMRNPIKFMQPFHIAVLILFGYGLEGMSRMYLDRSVSIGKGFLAQLKSWWTALAGFEKGWVFGCFGFVGASFLGWLMFMSGQKELTRYLGKGGFTPEQTESIIRFSGGEILLYLLFLALAVGVMCAVMSGYFRGTRRRWGLIMLGLLLAVDLIRANAPWLVFYDYKALYASNPIIDFLRQKPMEHRVVSPRFPVPKEYEYFPVVCFGWLEHLYQYYRIQTLDINQIPRMPADYDAYYRAFGSNPVRMWQLTNTRYLLALSSMLDAINQQLDPERRRFRIHTAFGLADLVPTRYSAYLAKVTTNANGPFALMEFTGALPRAKLYADWQPIKDDSILLKQLADPGFDPASLVLVSGDAPAPPAHTTEITNAGSVEFVQYEFNRVRCTAKAAVPSIMLLNDRYHPNWKLFVDNQPAALLRCNYLMRGVHLTPGTHEIDFKFEPSPKALYVTFAGVALGIILCGVVVIVGWRKNEAVMPATPSASGKPSI